MPDAYDAIPYQSHPFAQSHPDRLAGLARLFGLRPPAVETARILEVGAAAGGNIIPIAELIPSTSVLGIERSARQVADGQQAIRDLGLTNIELRQADIRDLDESLGEFDYVIAHGVYSWVPPDVQDKLLAVCRRHLAPDGVAYVSYNTLPGWSMRGVIRQMMLFHARQFPDPAERVRQARGALDFFAKSVPADNPYGAFLRGELEALRQAGDYYITHEHLEEDNHPCLFADFAAHAGRHGLRFLAEADLQTMLASHFPPEVQETLRRVSGNMIYLEQYMDFLRNRMFRQTLLVHADRQPAYDLRPAALAGTYVATAVRPERPGFDPYADGLEKFVSDVGPVLQAGQPIVKAALAELAGRWPRRIRFEDLVERARARLGGDPAADDVEKVGLALLQFLTTGGPRVIELTTRPLDVAAGVPDRPRAAAGARRQASRAEPVATLRHETFPAADFDRVILQLLDGTNDRAAVTAAVLGWVKTSALTLRKEGRVVTDPAEAEPLIAGLVTDALARFARVSLLLAEPPAGS
jgi:methyltransferase-like protein/trans-aconitate methyltransferase